MSFDLVLGIGIGVLLTLFLAGAYRIYHVLATKYLLARMKNQLQQDFLEAQQQILDNTIKPLEDHAKDED